MYCPSCGTVIDDNSKFCLSCGQNLEDAKKKKSNNMIEEITYQDEDKSNIYSFKSEVLKKRTKSKKTIIIPIVIAVLLAVIYLIVRHNISKPIIIKNQDFDFAQSFDNGLALVIEGIGKPNEYGEYDSYKYGYIDKNGEEVIPLKYEYATQFNEGLSIVKDSEDGLWKMIKKP